ncbi:MAG: glycerol-3-phosphate 1-O-acyltransferase PlsY [Lachnospiraceae bacterium]|nr:glycerol-3-phosphate 1-O-acyltransferase PlsY [Lachnospiraceae bacterium]
MIRLICLLIGYAFGCFQTAYIYGRLHGIDIRNYGSGNAGTTNSLRVLGKKAGIIVLLCDMLKTGLAIILVRVLFREQYGDILYLLAIYAAAGSVLGHNFPFYLGFKGGKGIACTAGLIIFFHPYLVLPQAVSFLTIFFTTHYVSLGSLVTEVLLIAEMVIFGQLGVFGMSQRALNELYIVTILLAALAFWGHRANIKRLIHKEERKTYLNKKEKDSQ